MLILTIPDSLVATSSLFVEISNAALIKSFEINRAYP